MTLVSTHLMLSVARTPGATEATLQVRSHSERTPMPAKFVLLLIGLLTISGCGNDESARQNAAIHSLKQTQLALENYHSSATDAASADVATDMGRDADKAADVPGELREFHYSPDGNVDGMTLKDGTEVRFPPNAGSKVTVLIAVGDQVEIIGWTHAHESEVHAATIKNTANGSLVDVDQPPPNVLNTSARK